jgi:hypothetical protein
LPLEVARDFEPNWLAEELFERRDVPVRRPQLEFRVAVRAQAGEVIVTTREQIESAERLRVAAIQALGEPDHRGQGPNVPPQRSGKVAEALV